MCYFGVWSNPEAAERLRDRQKVDLLAGREHPHAAVINSEVTVNQLCDEFLRSQNLKVKHTNFYNGSSTITCEPASDWQICLAEVVP